MHEGKVSNRLIRTGAFVTSISVLTIGSILCWGQFQPSNKNPALSSASKYQPGAPRLQAYRIDAIAEQHLFGKPTAKVIKPVPVVLPAKVEPKLPPLQAKVLGIIHNDHGKGVAVIRHGGREYAYKTGEELLLNESVVLSRVDKDRVVLERQGQLETIELEPRQEGSAGIQSHSSIARASEPDNPPSAQGRIVPAVNHPFSNNQSL